MFYSVSCIVKEGPSVLWLFLLFGFKMSRYLVSGQFSYPQKLLYSALLEVQEACITLCIVDTSLESIYHSMLELLGKQLRRLGIIPKSATGIQLLRVSAVG